MVDYVIDGNQIAVPVALRPNVFIASIFFAGHGPAGRLPLSLLRCNQFFRSGRRITNGRSRYRNEGIPAINGRSTPPGALRPEATRLQFWKTKKKNTHSHKDQSP